MPELPDVAHFRKYFREHAVGRKIACVRSANPKIVRGVSRQELESLAGAEFISTRQHGKYLFCRLDRGVWLVMHFGMTGYLHYFEEPEQEPAYSRVLFGFEGGGMLAYVNQRMLGWIGLVEKPESVIEGRGLGPSVLDGEFDFETFKDRLEGRKGEIKAALMNQGIMAGIGNVYSDEILLQARIYPRTRANTLSKEQLRTLFARVKDVLKTAVERNADTSQFPENFLLRNRRKGAACPVCASKLQSMKVSGRTSVFCPKCQPQD